MFYYGKQIITSVFSQELNSFGHRMPFYIDDLAMQLSWSEVSKVIQRGGGMCVCWGRGLLLGQ